MSRLSFLYIYSSGSCRTHLLGNKNCGVMTPLAEEYFTLFLSFLSQIWCLKMTEPLKNYFENLQNYILVSLMFWILKKLSAYLSNIIWKFSINNYNVQMLLYLQACGKLQLLEKKTHTLVNRNTFKCIPKKQIEIEKN